MHTITQMRGSAARPKLFRTAPRRITTLPGRLGTRSGIFFGSGLRCRGFLFGRRQAIALLRRTHAHARRTHAHAMDFGAADAHGRSHDATTLRRPLPWLIPVRSRPLEPGPTPSDALPHQTLDQRQATCLPWTTSARASRDVHALRARLASTFNGMAYLPWRSALTPTWLATVCPPC